MELNNNANIPGAGLQNHITDYKQKESVGAAFGKFFTQKLPDAVETICKKIVEAASTIFTKTSDSVQNGNLNEHHIHQNTTRHNLPSALSTIAHSNRAPDQQNTTRQASHSSQLEGTHDLGSQLLQHQLTTTDSIQKKCESFGHEWGLTADVQIGGKTVKVEGSDRDVNHTKLAASIKRYFVGNPQPASRLSADQQKVVQQCVEKSSQLHKGILSANEVLADYHQGLPITIQTGWAGHAVEVTMCSGYLVYTNRGSQSQGETSGKLPGNMMVYQITKPVTEEFIKKLCETGGLSDINQKPGRMLYIEGKDANSMAHELGLNLLHVVEKESQKVGNCGWANAKGGFYASMMLMMMKEKLDDSIGEIRKQNPKLSVQEAKSQALSELTNATQEVFKDWEVGSRHQELKSFLGLHDAVAKGKIDLSPKDYFRLLSQAGNKICIKEKFQKGEFVQTGLEMRNDIQATLKNSKLSLKDCVQEKAIAEDVRDLLKISQPGAFMLYTLPNNPRQIMLSYNKGNEVVDMPCPPAKNMRELMTQIPLLSTPVILEGTYVPILQKNRATMDAFKSKVAENRAEAMRRSANDEPAKFMIYKNSSGNTVLCQRLPRFAQTSETEVAFERECGSTEYLDGILKEMLSNDGQFKVLQEQGCGFGSSVEAYRAMENDTTKKMVVYKENGEYFALRREPGTTDCYEPEKLPVEKTKQRDLFIKLNSFDSTMIDREAALRPIHVRKMKPDERSALNEAQNRLKREQEPEGLEAR